MNHSAAAKELPVSFAEWMNRAREVMEKSAFDYVAGGAGREETILANRESFAHWRIQPRMLHNVSERNLGVSLFGHSFPSPFLLAPISIQGIVHPDAERASAGAAASLGVPFVLSNVSSLSMENVAAVMGKSPRWFQLFWGKDPDVTTSMLHRAEASGYSAIVVTLDLPVYGWRERDIRNGFFPFREGAGIANYVSDPAFRAKLKSPPEKDMKAAIALFGSIFFNPGLTWKDIPFLRQQTKLPILLKGILQPRDAEMAIEQGVDGVIVSNHGGRQVDGAVAALDALPQVSRVVKKRIPVLMDSGIRGGADIIKAIALGASAVLVGRPYIYGLAVAGETGVRRVLENLLADLDATMASAGAASIFDLNRSMLVQGKGETTDGF